MLNVTGMVTVAVAGVFLIAGASEVVGQPLLSISDGFGSSSSSAWLVVNSPEAQPGNFVPSGGNPSWYASLAATTSVNNRTGTGYRYQGAGSSIVLGTAGTQITLGADLRRASIPRPGLAAPELVPIIVQGSRLYQPASFIPGPTLSEWTTIAPVTFNVSEFTNSSGVPLDLSASVTIGFWWRFNALPSQPSGSIYGVGVDNLTLAVIPAPGAMATVLVGLAALARRRRG